MSLITACLENNKEDFDAVIDSGTYSLTDTIDRESLFELSWRHNDFTIASKILELANYHNCLDQLINEAIIDQLIENQFWNILEMVLNYCVNVDMSLLGFRSRNNPTYLEILDDVQRTNDNLYLFTWYFGKEISPVSIISSNYNSAYDELLEQNIAIRDIFENLGIKYPIIKGPIREGLCLKLAKSSN